MLKKGSVAPKERVNITYRPSVGDAKEEVELPLKLLILGDFTMRQDDTPVEDRETVNVNKDNFSEVLGAHDVKLEAVVPDKLSEEEGAQMTVNLDFKSMRDFEPDEIIKKVPELKKLYELREALKALKGPLGNVPAFKKKITELVQDDTTRAQLLKELGLNE
jgi:type VI secretion system protein ImpB